MVGNEDPDGQIAELQKQTQVLNAEKAKLDAEKAKLEAEKAKLDLAKSIADATPDPELQKLQKQKALADAQRTTLDSEAALVAARAASDQASRDSARKLAELQSEKALIDARKALGESKRAAEQAVSDSAGQLTSLQSQKALLEARKAVGDAETQAMLAKYIGDVKAGPYSGSVDLKDKAGTAEAALLAARAVEQAAKKIAAVVNQKCKGCTVHVFALKDFPGFQRLLTFRFRKQMLQQAFAAANITAPTLNDTDGAGAKEESLPLAAVSAGLDAFAKLAGFFKTDYTSGGVELKLDESLLLFAAAGQLVKADLAVRLPSVFAPSALTTAVEALGKEMAQLARLRAVAADASGRAKELAAASERSAAAREQQASANDTQSAAKKAEADAKAESGAPKVEVDALKAEAARIEGEAARLRALKDADAKDAVRQKARAAQVDGVIALHDAFATALTAPDASGAVPLSFLSQELSLDDDLTVKEGRALLLRLESAGGGYLVKKNLLTGLGCMPLFHMGGATVSYVLLEGKTGAVLASGVVPVHGGFVRSDKLAKKLAKEVA